MELIEEARRFGDERQYICHSWLLFSGLKEIPSEKSNILRFQELFDIVKVDYKEREAEWRIFGQQFFRVVDYAEKTSFQRQVKQYLLAGGRMPMEVKNKKFIVSERTDFQETESEVIENLRKSPFLYGSYCRLNEEWKRRFLDFYQGKKTLPLTYDPFFKRIFHPDIHADRLSRLVSSLLGMEVKIVHVLPNEDSMMGEDTLLIMDLLGEVEDGTLINIEIQKQSYAFPAERMSCYSTDLVMRQYARVKGKKGKEFTYRDIKKVYVIVIFEQSAGILSGCS